MGTRKELSLSERKVVVNVYDIVDLASTNDRLYRLGLGVYHTGVVLGRREYAYGFKWGPGTGVFYTTPRCAPNARYRQSLEFGPIIVTATEARERFRRVCEEFTGSSYHLLDKNCNTFTARVVYDLTGQKLPSWINRTARWASVFRCLLPPELAQPQSVPSAEMLPSSHALEYRSMLSGPPGTEECSDGDAHSGSTLSRASTPPKEDSQPLPPRVELNEILQ
ncbi:hypothetical protein, conserved [Cyanidioschyzon merolae strain 10D]|jgi:hypothetical protein|uniref:PPPDE domain-containing protein n=1 Tax=Cyanidioschyzon merolae (strain NIES-3377 / 10D) TaxID=280699 RepID=M1V7F6_CYAM1|nr:hypothetical protein, conserved [Cyanidioschyzon merolae strain 10D]BAM83050.1 hypothetical protein, conserved [Cyanidioschyzon merolae strain 10D]|eukprot:XP_005539086.1 hypothetical protein, conserved [Cyanidioschyzon merolae strain 10D]